MPTLYISFDKTQPEGQQFNVVTTGGSSAKNIHVRATENITWQIASAVPSGTTFSTSEDKPGIVFTPTTGTPSTWPNSKPTGNTTYWTVMDAVSKDTKGTFAYTINVVTPNGTHYSTDPDVTNSPQGG